jgi:hypothetical protein
VSGETQFAAYLEIAMQGGAPEGQRRSASFALQWAAAAADKALTWIAAT